MARSPCSVPTLLCAIAGLYAGASCGGLDKSAYSFLHTHEAEKDVPMEGIVCISGTNRPDNYTARALGIVVEAFRQSHIDPLVFDARTLSLAFPGHPDPGDGERLRTAIAAAPGVILATPEYHGSFCAMTKLIIENLGFPSVLAGKPVGLVGVAAGRIGAIKALEQLKSVCAHIGAIVVPGAVSVAGVQQVFDERGRCTNADVEAMLRGVAPAMLTFLKDYICPRHILEDMVRSGAEPWATTMS